MSDSGIRRPGPGGSVDDLHEPVPVDRPVPVELGRVSREQTAARDRASSTEHDPRSSSPTIRLDAAVMSEPQTWLLAVIRRADEPDMTYAAGRLGEKAWGVLVEGMRDGSMRPHPDEAGAWRAAGRPETWLIAVIRQHGQPDITVAESEVEPTAWGVQVLAMRGEGSP